jgi:hypothetical protein
VVGEEEEEEDVLAVEGECLNILDDRGTSCCHWRHQLYLVPAAAGLSVGLQLCADSINSYLPFRRYYAE